MRSERLIRDLRDAFRMLGRRPLWLIVAVVSIAAGSGLNVGMYALLRHVLFESPLTAAAPDRFVSIEPGLSFPDYQDLRRFDLPLDLAAMQMGTLIWTTGDATRTLSAHIVSDNFFGTIGVSPVVGRLFQTMDRGTDVVVLSYPFWQHEFAGEARVVGRSLDLNGWPHLIVGVLPQGFAATPLVGGVVYVPVGSHVSTALDNRRAAQFDLIGRLHAGVSVDQAMAALRVAAGQVEHEFPDMKRGLVRNLRASSPDAFSQFRGMPVGRAILGAAGMLYGLVSLVLLVICANVAGLLLTRANERCDEMAIRLALGATRGRLIQAVFVESFVIATLGCLSGLGLTAVAVALVRHGIAATTTTDLTALYSSVRWGYCLLLIPVVTAVCGLASATHLLRFANAVHLEARRNSYSSPRLGLQRGLVALQMAVCFVLLAATAFFIENVARLRVTDPGFDVDHLVSVDVRLPPASTPRDRFVARNAIAAEPGVETVSWGSPIGPPFTERLQRIASVPEPETSVDVRGIGPRFFETMRIPVIRGRDILDTDVVTDARVDQTAVVINETFVNRYLAGVEPIGQRFIRAGNPDAGRPRQVLQIVGVARDALARTIGESRVPVVYLPEASPSLTARVRRVDAGALALMHDRLRRLEPPGSVIDIVPFADRVDAAIAPVRILSILLTTLAAIALVLATTGLYAVVSYTVTRRTFEIGIRVAVGATQRSILALVLRDGVRVVAFGSLAGAVWASLIAAAGRRLIVGQSLVSPADYVVVTCLLLAIGLTASLRPALRGAATDAIRALRHE